MFKLPRLLIITCLLSGTCTTYAGVLTDSLVKTQADTSTVTGLQLIVKKTNRGATLEWKGSFSSSDILNVQFSNDGDRFTTLKKTDNTTTSYNDEWPPARTSGYYRLERNSANGIKYSNMVMIGTLPQTASIQLQTNPVTELVKLKISNPIAQNFTIEWRRDQGTLMQSQSFAVSAGINFLQFEPPIEATPGTYYLRVMSDDKKQRQLFRVVKQ